MTPPDELTIIPAVDLQSLYIKNFRRVDDNLLAGVQPQLPEGIQELASKYGVKTVIDLQSVGGEETQEDFTCAQLGIEFHSIPLPGIEILDDLPEAKIQAVMAVINDPSKWPVFVHCKFGKDRTGCIVGIHRVDQGWPLEQVLAEMKRYHRAFLMFGFRAYVEDYFEKQQASRQP